MYTIVNQLILVRNWNEFILLQIASQSYSQTQHNRTNMNYIE